jgi:hypothetical protein
VLIGRLGEQTSNRAEKMSTAVFETEKLNQLSVNLERPRSTPKLLLQQPF